MSTAEVEPDVPAPARPRRPTPARWRWSNWSLTHRLPVLAAGIVVLVVAVSLALTYGALKRARIDETYERLRRLTRQLVITSDQTIKARQHLFRQISDDSAVRSVLQSVTTRVRAPVPPATLRAAEAALLRLRMAPDSSLPIELWTTDGRRVLHVGTDVRGDTLNALRPELRALNGRAVTEVPTGRSGSDSVQYGTFYSSGGRVLFWTIVPVMEGAERVGYLAQQRAFRSTPQAQATMKELLGNDAELNVHNAGDHFWASYAGEPIAPLAGVDTLKGDHIGQRAGVGQVIASEARVPGTPWIFSIEAPVRSVVAGPRATLRRLALINLVIAVAGVLAVWLVSRRITNPIVTLTSVSDAIARGDYDTRMPFRSGEWTKNEVARLSATFNRMAEEIETSHRELEKQRDAAEKANHAKSDFLAVMSHELRTPLNAIGGYADILQLGIYGELNDRQKDALSRIARSQQMLLSLINDVLNFAKLDAGEVQYRITDVALDEVLGGAEPLVSPQLAAKQLHFAYEGCNPPLVVRADRDKLMQILLNLLSNAIKFTAPEGSVVLSCAEEREWVRIDVRDTGAGIPPERLESIFDPFVQVDRALNRPHDGVGLGLSISRDLAEGMGGTLVARSKVGTGSTFSLRLRKG